VTVMVTPHKPAGAEDRVRNDDYTSDVRPQSAKLTASRVHDLSGTTGKGFLKGKCLFCNPRIKAMTSPSTAFPVVQWCAVIVSHSVTRSSPLAWWVTTTTIIVTNLHFLS
jgi:hypothetical protein